MLKNPQEPLSLAALETMFEGVNRAKVCLIGDFCLDLYWLADMRRSELSRETPHYPLPVVEEAAPLCVYLTQNMLLGTEEDLKDIVAAMDKVAAGE